MTIFLENGFAKTGMIRWIKDTTQRFILPFVTPEQRAALETHVNKMAEYPGVFECKCEVAQGAGGNAMKITITIAPKGLIQ